MGELGVVPAGAVPMASVPGTVVWFEPSCGVCGSPDGVVVVRMTARAYRRGLRRVAVWRLLAIVFAGTTAVLAVVLYAASNV